jgi:hypothetical protein
MAYSLLLFTALIEIVAQYARFFLKNQVGKKLHFFKPILTLRFCQSVRSLVPFIFSKPKFWCYHKGGFESENRGTSGTPLKL